MWSWSHTSEAYDNARRNLERLDRETLNVIYAEWHSPFKGDPHSFSEHKYRVAKKRAEKLDPDELVEFIWGKMSEQATCENGGFMAHCCNYHCGCHMVSFDDTHDEECDEVQSCVL